jgi:hypothetical protein
MNLKTARASLNRVFVQLLDHCQHDLVVALGSACESSYEASGRAAQGPSRSLPAEPYLKSFMSEVPFSIGPAAVNDVTLAGHKSRFVRSQI